MLLSPFTALWAPVQPTLRKCPNLQGYLTVIVEGNPNQSPVITNQTIKMAANNQSNFSR